MLLVRSASLAIREREALVCTQPFFCFLSCVSFFSLFLFFSFFWRGGGFLFLAISGILTCLENRGQGPLGVYEFDSRLRRGK